MERIRLGNTVFEGQNNVYLLDGDETVLVDTGVAVADTQAELADGLAEHGVALADVDRVFLTHWHWDHSGLAGEIQAESGATVHIHEADAPLVGGDEAALREEQRLLRDRLADWNLPDEPRQELLSFMDGHRELGGEPADVTPFGDGETFEVNGAALEAVHLPGHSAGLSAFAFEGTGEELDVPEAAAGAQAFVGDAVLPKYTPNVGGADVRVDRPLAKYLDSLERVVERDWAVAWPGHRDAIADPTDRARYIVQHHRERTEKVLDVLDRHGPCDAWAVSAHLFGNLETIHILHGPGEAFAHLDHLAEAGVVERDGTDYHRVEAEPDLSSLFPSV